MNDQQKHRPSESKEDEINADNKAAVNKVDALKTGSSKKGKTYDKPFDEQMYDSFDDIREQEKPAEE